MAAEARTLNALSALLAALALVGCSAADIPKLYHGRAGQAVLAVPSRIAGSVLYEGESDWTPPEKPKAERTDRDPIRGIEFYIDLDHPNRVITDQAARDRLLEWHETLHLPAVVGHIVAINVDFPNAAQPSAAAIRSFYGSSKFAEPAFQALEPVSSEYELETRRADWSKPVKGREPHGGSIFDVDVDYLSTSENIYLYCNDARQVVTPFAPMPTCQFLIVVPELGARMSGSIDRGDVRRWRELRHAARATLLSFVVAHR